MRAEIDTQPGWTDSWCSVDSSTGSLVVTLDPKDCFSAEIYLDEIGNGYDFSGAAKEDQRGTSCVCACVCVCPYGVIVSLSRSPNGKGNSKYGQVGVTVSV